MSGVFSHFCGFFWISLAFSLYALEPEAQAVSARTAKMQRKSSKIMKNHSKTLDMYSKTIFMIIIHHNKHSGARFRRF